MSVKTVETSREKAVQLRKEGKTYTQIEKATGLSRPTVAKILKEAGLTGQKAAPQESMKQPAVSVGSSAIPISNGDGLTEFQPPPKKEHATVNTKKNEEPKGGRVYCGNCGTGFDYTDESEVPDKCPECGA